MSEEKRKSEADSERPPKPGGSKSAAEKRSEERRAARAGAAKPKRDLPRPKKPASKPRSGSPKSRKPAPRPARKRHDGPGTARLFALVAGALLALLGVIGFFYDASFDTGANLVSDDLAGTLMVNGWRNVVYLLTGVAALALAPRRARATALGLGLFYLGYAIWGFIVTERGIGDILDVLPLSDDDNALHLVIGILGLLAALVDGPLPKVPESIRKRLRGLKPKPRKRKPRKRAEAEKGKTKRKGDDAKAKPKTDEKKPKRSPVRESLAGKASGKAKKADEEKAADSKPAAEKPESEEKPARAGREARDRRRAAPRRDGDDEPR